MLEADFTELLIEGLKRAVAQAQDGPPTLECPMALYKSFSQLPCCKATFAT